MEFGKKTIALIFILSCLIGIAYAGTSGDMVEAGEPAGTPAFIGDEEAGFEEEILDVLDEELILPEESPGQPEEDFFTVSLDALIQQNADASIAIGSATVSAGNEVTIPISVANLTGAEGIGFEILIHDPWPVEALYANATVQIGNRGFAYNITHGVDTTVVSVALTHDPLTVGTNPRSVASITLKAKPDVIERIDTELMIMRPEWSHAFVNVPFDIVQDGLLTITPPVLPDLTGVLDPAPPEYIKKYKNGTIFMDPTFVIRNIGEAAVNQDFKIFVVFVGEEEEWTIQASDDPIGAGQNYTVFTDITIDPSLTGTNVIEEIGQGEITLTITAKGDISPGQKEIGIRINPDRRVEELRYDNNNITTQATITYPDLKPILTRELIAGLSDSKTIIQEDVIPGTHRVTYGVQNNGTVYSVPTYLNVTENGVTIYHALVPALQPGENWTQSRDIQLDKTKGTKTYTVEVNAAGPQGQEPTEKIKYPDASKASITITGDYSSFKPVTVIFPHVEGEPRVNVEVPVRLSNISAGAPVGSFEIPVTFDPTVSVYAGATGVLDGVTVTQPGYGRLLVKGTGVNYGMDTTVATLLFRAQSDAGRTAEISSLTTANVKTTENQFLELEITRGAFTQKRFSDARISIWAPTVGSEGQNVSFSVTVWNTKTLPVNISANVKLQDDTTLWSLEDIELGSRQSRSFTVNTWKPGDAGTYTLTGRLAGDDDPTGNVTTRQVRIDSYQLVINQQNKDYWDQWYGYNRSVVQGNSVMLGTYYTSNQPGQINATVRIWYPDGTLVDTSVDTPFRFSRRWYAPEMTIYGWNSNWNNAIWYSIVPQQLGRFNYSIELEARGEFTYVNGTLVVREQNADIKVLNSTSIEEEEGGIIWFNIFNREVFEDRRVQIVASAGAEGRTLSGLEYLVGYPHGCPEQAMSPALATLRVKQYYASRGKLTDQMNETFRRNMLRAYDMHKSTSTNNPQKLFLEESHSWYGSWAWGRTGSPTFFYTLYPNYVFTELWHDMEEDPTYWGFNLTNTTEINLTASTEWMINRQKADGGWQEWGYVSNRYEWTGWVSEKFVGEFGYLTTDGQLLVNQSLNKSYRFLASGNYNNEPTKAVAYGIYGLTAIKEHYKENTTLGLEVDAKNQELQARLIALRQGNQADGFFWQDGWYNDAEATAHAVLALNKSGLPADNETVLGGIRWLVSQYDTNGRWGNTRASAAVINTLTQVQIPATVDFTAKIEILRDEVQVRAPQTFTFNDDNVRHSFSLTQSELNTLYGSTTGNFTGRIVITEKSDYQDPDNVSKMVISVQSLQKVPLSVAIATIPEVFIDPIADDFFLAVSIPSLPAPGLNVDSPEVNVTFQADNRVYYQNGTQTLYSKDQNVMILEIPISAAVNFTGSDNGNDRAYFIAAAEDPEPEGQFVYLNHMVNRTTGKLYVYPGSNNETRPSLAAGEVRNFHVPLKFAEAGSHTVEGRLYPMYGSPNAPEHGDEWMALANATAYVKGYGNITLTAVNETGGAVLADFYIDGTQVATNTNTTSHERLEGTHQIAILSQNPGQWVNTTLTVQTGQVSEYSAQFVTDTSIPHITTVSGAAGDVLMNPPEIEETISNTSTNHWRATVPARKVFNSTISSAGGVATIAVDVPVVERLPTAVVDPGDDEWRPNSTILRGIVEYQYLNSSGHWNGPFNVSGIIQDDKLTVSDVNTGEIVRVVLTFGGRPLGDVRNDGQVTSLDATRILRYEVGLDIPTIEDKFYGDTNNDGRINSLDATKILRREVGLDNDFYT